MHGKHGWVRVAAATPDVAIANPERNVQHILTSLEELAEARPDLVVLPELCLTGYTCGDLFQQSCLQQTAQAALDRLLVATAENSTVLAVGLPLAVGGRLFNCAAVMQYGQLLGMVPKSVIPNYREFYEGRWFASGSQCRENTVSLGGFTIPFGTDLLFVAESDSRFAFGVEVCEDLWAPIPPSTNHALAGAAILLNLSASNELAGKADYRRQLVIQQSGRCLAAYAYSSSGPLESTTDLVFGGHCMIAENAVMLDESPRFQRTRHAIVADLDLEFLLHERLQNQAFNSQVGDGEDSCRRISFRPRIEEQRQAGDRLRRLIPPLPFVPGDSRRRQERCREIMAIQSHGLATRLHNTGIDNLVLGLSGGLDSTLALLVAIEAGRHLQLPAANIHGLTLPGFGTSRETLKNVTALCECLGIDLHKIDIRPACEQHFRDLGHDGKTGDLAFENIQARERTQILMNQANMLKALVVGTGDLSELALGWCTYNADHISMYHVNAGVPKTLVSYLIENFADTIQPTNPELPPILRRILETPISPELLPHNGQDQIHQETEKIIGPYRLHDFFLYHLIRCGAAPSKVLILARQAFESEFDTQEIQHWLVIFIKRFFTQQFKRSCMPDGPKVGTIALSPRGDWRMPSDAAATAWLEDLEDKKEERLRNRWHTLSKQRQWKKG